MTWTVGNKFYIQGGEGYLDDAASAGEELGAPHHGGGRRVCLDDIHCFDTGRLRQGRVEGRGCAVWL